jgi:hypothetical protein
MYSYQPVFRECFGKEITSFSGRVTKAKASEFRAGVDRMASNKSRYNCDAQQMMGYIDNCTFDNLVKDLYRVCDLMDRREIGYLNIG